MKPMLSATSIRHISRKAVKRLPGKVYQMNQPRWEASAECFACQETSAPYTGMVSLTVLQNVRSPLTAPSPKGKITVMGEGYHWIQLAPADEHWWLTAMYDEKLQLVQFYFDVTFQNHILPNGSSFCEDAYLDVVLNPDGSTRILDADELNAALASGEISRAQYELARDTAQKILCSFSGKSTELTCLTTGYLRELLPKLPHRSTKNSLPPLP